MRYTENVLLLLTALPQLGCLSRQIDEVLDQARMSCPSSGTTEPDGMTEPDTTGDTTDSTTNGSLSETGSTTTVESTTVITESDTSWSSGTTETTGPMPACGNGILETEGPMPEECDDGNLVPDDGCDDTCARDRIVFVTSTLYLGGDIGGVGLADSICINRAGDVDLPGPLNYRAWLSDSETDARDRIKPGRGRYVLPNGLVVADSWEELLAGEIQNPIDVTEKLEVYHGGVWTGTRPDGTRVPDGIFCADWTSNLMADTAHYGYSDELYPGWTLAPYFDNPITCVLEAALYCFEQRE